MQLKWMAVVGLGLLSVQVRAQVAPAPALKTQKEKTSYAIGVQVATGVKSQGIDVDPETVAKAFKDVLAGGKLLMTDEEMKATLTALQQEVQARQTAAAAKAGEANKTEGEAFLAKNAKAPGVVALPSGLQYKILKAGTGKKPEATDTVLVNYRGTFINGKEFDSSLGTGKPATFPLNAVIPGFREALTQMPVGSKWQVFIPSSLAYGERGAGGAVGPNATLIFEMELVSIQGK